MKPGGNKDKSTNDQTADGQPPSAYLEIMNFQTGCGTQAHLKPSGFMKL